MRAPTRFNQIDLYRKAGKAVKPLYGKTRQIKHRPVDKVPLDTIPQMFKELSGPIADYITGEREKKDRENMQKALMAYRSGLPGQKERIDLSEQEIMDKYARPAKDAVIGGPMDIDETSDDIERRADDAWFNALPDIDDQGRFTQGKRLEGFDAAVAAAGDKPGPVTQKMLNALLLSDMDRKQAKAVRDEERIYQEGLATAKAQRDIELKGSPGWEKTKKPVPGKDVPYPEEVAKQLTEIAAAKASSTAGARESAKVDNISKMPMPSAIIKIVDDHGSAISTAMGINVDFANITKQLEDNKFDPGLFSKIESSVRNYVGASTPESRAYGSYKTKLEKIRNDSLRLNKGMQTEGDATRAMNEIIANANDKEFVKLRLKELQVINRRAIELRQYQADSILKQFGRPPLKIPGFKKPAANALPEGITEEDVAETMKANNMTREQVLERLRNGG